MLFRTENVSGRQKLAKYHVVGNDMSCELRLQILVKIQERMKVNNRRFREDSSAVAKDHD